MKGGLTTKSNNQPPADLLQWLDVNEVKLVALETSGDRELLGYMKSRPEWQVDFEDPGGTILVRRPSA